MRDNGFCRMMDNGVFMIPRIHLAKLIMIVKGFCFWRGGEERIEDMKRMTLTEGAQVGLCSTDAGREVRRMKGQGQWTKSIIWLIPS